ncbi:MAG: helix-turn-helix domain-containing protein [Chloroflexota bacterium]|nr:ATP-binding protein [Lentimicrobium sp.]
MPSYIRTLINEGEHQQLDFKFGVNDSRKIARTLAAFANTDGGRLLLGVKDNGAVAGVRSDEEYYMMEAGAQLYCKPPVTFEMHEWEEGGKNVLEIIVPKSNEVHSAPDKDGNYKVFIRIGDQNYMANGVMLKVWQKRKNINGVKIKFTETERALINYLEKNGRISINTFKKLSGLNVKKCEHILADFIVLNILKINYSETGVYYTLDPEFRLNDEPA